MVYVLLAFVMGISLTAIGLSWRSARIERARTTRERITQAARDAYDATHR